jgi:CRISPR-associated endonuclease Csn1
VLPLLEKGKTYSEALVDAYGVTSDEGSRTLPDQPLDILPPLSKVTTVRNPIVQRALSETRKVVNAILRRYGKPDKIRIELARDLKKNAKQREAVIKRMRTNETANQKAKERLAREEGLQKFSRTDILKVLLFEECGGHCPYTNEPINWNDLFGDHPRFDIEHIIPFSRCFDDSFMNKPLCLASENRNVKGKKTPWEAYGSNPERFEEIIERVSRFKGDGKDSKLWRFQRRR